MLPRKNIAVAAGLFSLIIALALLTGCTASSAVAPTPTPWPTSVVVQRATYTVQKGSVADYIVLDGRASPTLWEPLFVKVDGKLLALNASEGALVKKGDLLAELDTKALTEQLTQAQLSVEQVQSQAQQQDVSKKYALERARVNLQIQELALQKLRRSIDESGPLQRAQAEKDLERTRVSLDRAQAAYNLVASRADVAALPQAAALQTATIDYQLAEIKYKLASQTDTDSQVAAQELQVQLARINLKELEDKAQSSSENDITKAKMQVDAITRQIDDRRLRAPYDGIITAIGINLQGMTRGFAQRPKVGDNIAAYSALIVIARPEPLEITIDGSQKRVSELYIGQPVTITHAAWARPFVAQITALPVAMSASGNQTQSSQAVRIALPTNAPPMSNGDPVRVTVQAALHENVLFIHPSGVRRFAGRAFVVLQDGERQRRVDVTLGLENDQQVEVVSGLRGGDVVISP